VLVHKSKEISILPIGNQRSRVSNNNCKAMIQKIMA